MLTNRHVATLSALALLSACESASERAARQHADVVAIGAASAGHNPDDLIEEFERNELAADLAYKNQWVRVDGVVDRVGKGMGEEPLLVLETERSLVRAVQCWLAPLAIRDAAALSAGQRVSVFGVAGGLNVHVALRHCVVVPGAVAERPAPSAAAPSPVPQPATLPAAPRACSFLATRPDFRMGPWHDVGGGQYETNAWQCISREIELGPPPANGGLRNTIAYYVVGVESEIRDIHLALTLSQPDQQSGALQMLADAANEVSKAAYNEHMPAFLRTAIYDRREANAKMPGGAFVVVQVEPFGRQSLVKNGATVRVRFDLPRP